MLLTRCPDCDTTFRVTDETLKKANGQVRCGRCASVFNAYAELQDSGAKSYEAPPPPSVLTTPRRAEPAATAEASAPQADAAPTARPETGAESTTSTTAEVVAETASAVVENRRAAAESSAEAEDFESISAHQVDEVLTSTA